MLFKVLFVLLAVFLSLGAHTEIQAENRYPTSETNWWKIQSIDTMKYSRDLSGQVRDNPEQFRPLIQSQVRDIASLGATHVAIATPYDDQFLPVIQLWVDEARARGLKIWFRGNFSGWEGWFGYQRINREDHKTQLKNFLTKNPNLFQDGDIFSPCPECENGGPGDPRVNGDPTGHAQFLIDEYQITQQAFANMGKNVETNLHSMNGDVARLIMTPQNTLQLGRLVTVDHYVKDPEKLALDIRAYAQQSGGQVMLGEYGVPIPDIHGNLSPDQQAAWIDQSLSQLVRIPDLIGINYWVSMGGSTALWNEDGSARPATATLKKYFSPSVFSGQIVDFDGEPIEGVKIKTAYKTVQTDKNGNFAIAYLLPQDEVIISSPDYFPQTTTFANLTPIIKLEHQPLPLAQSLRKSLMRMIKNLRELFL